MKFLCCLLVVCCVFTSTISFAQSRYDSVMVLPQKMPTPADAKKIGSIKAGNNATSTHCDYEALITEAKKKALNMGGNIVKIISLNNPVFISSCYSINADVYYATNLPDYHIRPTHDTIGYMDTGYALLCFYRLADTIAFVPSYPVHLNNDSVVYRAKSKSYDAIKLAPGSSVTLWASIEKRQEIKLSVKPGEVYYLRCGLQKGEIRMIPVLQLVDKQTGEKEYNNLSRRKRDTGISYLQQVH